MNFRFKSNKKDLFLLLNLKKSFLNFYIIIFLILKRDNESLHNIPTIGHEINDYYQNKKKNQFHDNSCYQNQNPTNDKFKEKILIR